MKNPKISVIVPVYNVSMYLRQCMDSIINQTLKDIEIICVNDGSTDDSGKILDEYAENDARVKVIHKENTGYGNSMNIGFNMAQGEYIGIVESDDYIDEKMYEVLYDKVKTNDLDFVKAEHIEEVFDISCQTIRIDYDHIEYGEFNLYNKVIKSEELTINKWIEYEDYRNIWAGLYRLKYIRENNICFQETSGASFQDTGFHMQVLLTAKTFMIVDDKFYYYRTTNPNSSIHNEKKLHELFNEYEYVKEYMKNNDFIYNIKPEDMHDFICICTLRAVLWNYTRIHEDYVEELTYLIKDYIEKNSAFIYEHTLYQILHTPKEFSEFKIAEIKTNKSYMELKKSKSKIINLTKAIENAEKIIIYGTGIMSKHLYKQINKIDLKDRIYCYALTNTENQPEKINNIPVKKIDDIENKETLIIVAAYGINSRNMYKYAKKLGFENIMLVSEIV